MHHSSPRLGDVLPVSPPAAARGRLKLLLAGSSKKKIRLACFQCDRQTVCQITVLIYWFFDFFEKSIPLPDVFYELFNTSMKYIQWNQVSMQVQNATKANFPNDILYWVKASPACKSISVTISFANFPPFFSPSCYAWLKPQPISMCTLMTDGRRYFIETYSRELKNY